jgi:hypothetical protein
MVHSQPTTLQGYRSSLVRRCDREILIQVGSA